MRKTVLTVLTWSLAAVAQAAPPLEPVTTRIEAVNVAGREFVADGITWALSSTVVITVPGKARGSLGDVKPGMNVRVELADDNPDRPVVRSITVVPD
ncbi:MAG: hypothetical protein JNK40_10110 [Chromatiales bacterium]|nr:hypothetical protein [Chromatiales bacterium]